MSTETQEIKKPQILSVLTDEQIQELPSDAVADVRFLSSNLAAAQLQVFTPVVLDYLKLREESLSLKLVKGEDNEITVESIQNYKDFKANQRSFNGMLTAKIAEIKDPINATRNGIISIDKTFRTESNILKETAEKEFDEYEKEKLRKAKEAKDKKDALLKAEVDAAKQVANEATLKNNVSTVYNKIKYTLISEGITNHVLDVLDNLNEKSLLIEKSQLIQGTFEKLVINEETSILDAAKIEELKEAYDVAKMRSIKLIDGKLEQLEKDHEREVEAAAKKIPEPVKEEVTASSPHSAFIPSGNGGSVPKRVPEVPKVSENKINTIDDINLELEEGKMLFAVLTIVSTTIWTDKTPDECIEMINNHKNEMKI